MSILKRIFGLGKKEAPVQDVEVKVAEINEQPVAPYKIEAPVPTPEPATIKTLELPKTEEVVVPAKVARVKKTSAKPATATRRKTKTTKG
jgi:hypothetical protein